MTGSNPYWGVDFFEFLALFFSRLGQWMTGNLTTAELAADDVQVLVLSLIGISSALIGSLLVLKKMTMLANSLSHTILLGIVTAYVLGTHGISLTTLIIAALVAAWMTTVLTQGLIHWMKLQEDASIGLVFTTLFALGVVLVTLLTRNAHIGTEAVMGNVDALHVNDLKLAAAVAGFNAIVVLLFFKEFKLMAFDPAFAVTIGLSAALWNYVFMTMTALTAVAAFRAVGVLLVLALLVGPVLIARLYVKRLKALMAVSSAIGVGVSLVAVALARHLLSVYDLPLSTAGIVVTLIGVLYMGLLLCKRSSF